MEKEVYKNANAIFPLFPDSDQREIEDLSFKIIHKSGELKQQIPNNIVRAQIGDLVRNMNSYYSNLIEGHETLPRDIERALVREYSSDTQTRDNQLLSVAHVKTEEELEDWIIESHNNPFGVSVILWLHEKFYSKLPEHQWIVKSLTGEIYPLVPGQIRNYNVEVGDHIPPDHSIVNECLSIFEAQYQNTTKMKVLLAAAAAHHRLLWIHPFGDGNGRVARLQTQAVLISLGLHCNGLWTISRGLARDKADYYRYLESADMQRQNDFDGRGNLSGRYLSEFCVFFLSKMLDQIEFMSALLNLRKLGDRIENYVRTETDFKDIDKERIANLLRYILIDGEISRGQVGSIMNLQSSASRELVSECLKLGLLTSTSPKGSLRLGFNANILEHYFPSLYLSI